MFCIALGTENSMISQAICTVYCLYFIQTWWRFSFVVLTSALMEASKSLSVPSVASLWIWEIRMQNSPGPKHLHLFLAHDVPSYMDGGKKNWPLKSISSSIRFFCSGGWGDEPTMSVWSGILMQCRVACFSFARMCWGNLCSPAAPSPQHRKINWVTILVIS